MSSPHARGRPSRIDRSTTGYNAPLTFLSVVGVLKFIHYRRGRNREMKDFFRWSTVTKAWEFTKPYLIRMTGDMAADYADRVRRSAS
jgi:hypothetical protein